MMSGIQEAKHPCLLAWPFSVTSQSIRLELMAPDYRPWAEHCPKLWAAAWVT